MSDTLLLVGKIALLVLLYLFILSVVRSSSRDLRVAGPATTDQRWRMPGAGDEAEAAERSTAATVTMEGGLWSLAVLKSSSVPVGAAYVLPADSHALAGRLPDMDIFLDDTFVSAKHALFEVSDDGLWVEDLRSTNGTTVNGKPIHEPTRLQMGDRIGVGDTVFQVKVR